MSVGRSMNFMHLLGRLVEFLFLVFWIHLVGFLFTNFSGTNFCFFKGESNTNIACSDALYWSCAIIIIIFVLWMNYGWSVQQMVVLFYMRIKCVFISWFIDNNLKFLLYWHRKFNGRVFFVLLPVGCEKRSWIVCEFLCWCH